MGNDGRGGVRAPVQLRGLRFAPSLAVIVVLGLAARVAYVVVVGPHLDLGLDAIWYQLQAGTVARGQGYLDPDSFYRLGLQVPTANFPPLWPIMLAGANHLGLDSQTSYQLVGAFLGTVTVGLTGLLGRRVVGPGVGLVAALIVACCPMLIAADGSLMSESLYVALITAVLLSAYRALDRPTLMRFGVVGLALGLAALTRADALFLAPILTAALAWRVRGPSTGRRIVLGSCLLAMTAVVLIPWIASSSSRMGATVVMSSNSGNMLEGANCPSTYSGLLLGAWDAGCVNRSLAPGTSELTRSAASRAVAVDYARSHLARLPVVASARVLRIWGLWSPLDQARLESIETRNERWQLVGWSYDVLLLMLAVPGTVLLVRRRAEIAPLVAVVVAVVVTAAVSYGNQRFRLAADPVIAVVAAVTLLAAWRTTITKRDRETPLGCLHIGRLSPRVRDR